MAGNKTLNGLRMKLLQGRKVERGYTMDSGNCKRRDDGFAVEKHKDGSWTVKISIADVAAFVPINCSVNNTAMKQALNGNDNYLPFNLVTKAISLDKGRQTPAITYTVRLDSNFEITDYSVARTAFEPIQAITYKQYSKGVHEHTDIWKELATGIERKRFDKRVSTLREAFERAGASTSIDLEGKFNGRSGIVEQMQYLARRVTGSLFLHAGHPAFYVKHTPAVDIRGGVHELRTNVFRSLKAVTEAAYNHEDYNVDASSPIRRYDDLMMQRNLAAIIEGKPMPYDAAALKELRDFSRYASRASDRKLCLAFNQEDYSPDVPRIVRRGDTEKLKPAVSNLKRLTDLFAKHSAQAPEIISATVYHGATKIALDVAAVIDPKDEQILGMGVATSRKDAQNLAVRDAVVTACQKFCAAPA